MKGSNSDGGCCRPLTHRFIPIFLSFIFFVVLSAFTGEARATCHSTCYDIDLVENECQENGKSVFEYRVSVGINESQSCFGLDKFKLKVLDCSQVDSVQFPQGVTGTFSCTNGELLINPTGNEPDDNETHIFKVVMKTCQCPVDGDWRAIGSDNNCQFTGDTDVPGQCECLQNSDCEDDGNSCTNEVCNEDFKCEHTPNTGDSCDDGNPCTNEDSCHEGECEGTPIEGCKQCEGSGECDDGLVCNGEETCGENGTCQGGTPPVCEDDGNPCTNDLCTEDAGGCDHPNNENPCDDGDGCTLDDFCDGGECVGGAIIECFHERECAVGRCENGECLFDLSDCECDSAGECDDLNDCTVDSCNVNSGTCSNVIQEDQTCDDNDACTTGEQCNSDGLCAGGGPTNCDDNNTCTADSCDPGSGCQNEDNGTCEPPPPGGCGDGICDEGEDCECSDCAETQTCQIRAQQLKCAQDLVAESDGRLNAQEAEDLAVELIAQGEACTLILESGSGGLKVGGCTFQPSGAAPQVPWLGLAALMLGWTPLALLRRARVRKR